MSKASLIPDHAPLLLRTTDLIQRSATTKDVHNQGDRSLPAARRAILMA
jgi:hypothetical protein